MGKITAIVGSSRKGANCDAIVNAVMDGAMGLSTNEITLHYLVDFRSARGCKACMKCKIAGECSQDDEITDLLKEMKEANGIIISTPVYFDGPSAQLKVLIDRMYSYCNLDMTSNFPKGKDIVIIVTCGKNTEAAEHVRDELETIMVKRFGGNLLGSIVFCDEGSKDAAANDKKIFDEAVEIGRKMRNN